MNWLDTSKETLALTYSMSLNTESNYQRFLMRRVLVSENGWQMRHSHWSIVRPRDRSITRGW